jgi:hypothetical protein
MDTFDVSLRTASKRYNDEFFNRNRFAFVEVCYWGSYLITPFARASTLGGIVRPICFAAFRLIKNSNKVMGLVARESHQM